MAASHPPPNATYNGSEVGYPVQILKFREPISEAEGTEPVPQLVEAAVREIFGNPSIADKKVSIISNFGPYRQGKSYAHNLLRLHLEHSIKVL